ncbi:hypothetical protein HJ079_20890 [Vibrio parahaemolyticus]|nr:hypothetical protein [Vibrio parahaemolyticus]
MVSRREVSYEKVTLSGNFFFWLSVNAGAEKEFGVTIERNGRNVLERAKSARPFDIKDDEALLQAAQNEYFLPIIAYVGQPWVLPAGAFSGETTGAN